MRLGPAPDRALRHVDGLGAAMDLMREMPWHGRLSISTLAPLVVQALQEDRAHFALTEDDRPWGLAVWQWADTPTHHTWLATPPTLRQWAQQPKQAEQNATRAHIPTHLWFCLLVTPFCASLPLLRQLQQRLPQAAQAWAITPYGINANATDIDTDATPQTRPVW